MDLQIYENIERIEGRLLSVVEQQYLCPKEEMYLDVDRIELSYDERKVNATMHVSFGRYGQNLSESERWRKELELPLESDNLEFIAGQFFQALNDNGL